MAMHFFDEKKKVEDPAIAEKVLESAHARAEKIIERAIKKSEEIVEEMEQFKNEMQKELRPVFQQSAEKFIQTINDQSKQFSESCNELLPQIKEMYTSDVTKSLDYFKIELSKELAPIREIVDGKVQEAVVMLKSKIDEDWQTAHKEIEQYKEERKQRLATELESKLDELANVSFGKSLTVTQHQQLVMNALEKAKQDGIFKQ